VFNGHRGELHEIVFEYALSLGIPIKLGKKAVAYFEDENEAGVELEDGERVCRANHGTENTKLKSR
jgi:hypothetical protein